MIRTGGSIVVLSGAGISAESGISTFRDPDGIWARYRAEDIATPEGFLRDPDRVRAFYNERRLQLVSRAVEPNHAHFALADLERRWEGAFLLVTQNIDDLHERAGSIKLIHMHGELLKVRCTRTGRVIESREEITATTPCQCCSQPGTLRPHVVWFGEIPFDLDRIIDALRLCDLFVSVGTSGQVYPAAAFSEVARRHGARTVELNLESTGSSGRFDEVIHGQATIVVPEFVNRLLGGHSSI